MARVGLAGLKALQFARIEGCTKGTVQIGKIDVKDTFTRVACDATVAAEAE